MKVLNRANLAAVLALLLSTAADGVAEVRLESQNGRGHGSEEPLRLEVIPTQTGPWTLIGSLDPSVLNPTGDLHGDGLPGDSARLDVLLAAWTRPGEEQVLLSAGRDGGWDWLRHVETESPVGTPSVDAAGGGWIVTWQRGGALPAVLVVSVTLDGRLSVPEQVADGWLVGTAPTADGRGIYVLSMTPDGEPTVTRVVWSVPSVPSPVEIGWRVPLDPFPGWSDAPDRLPVLHAADGEVFAGWWLDEETFVLAHVGAEGVESAGVRRLGEGEDPSSAMTDALGELAQKTRYR